MLVTPDVGAMLLDRGYTGHEHLAEVGLIHMNGRLYDPVLRSFLMPDNFIQQPENTQNYNRYAYVLNNPLKYTDPSGEFIPLLAAVAIGAAIGALTYTMTALLADVPFTVGGLLKSTFIGAATAAVTFGVGCAASSMFSTPAVGFLQGAYQGAVIGAITGVGGVVANAIFTGQNITLKAVLGGAVTGAVMGAVVGGIQGGIRAQNNGKEFWSGKDDYQHIKIGSGQPTTFSSKVDFSDKKYDVDRSLNLKTHVQPEGSNICTYVEKMIADDFYCVTGQDQINTTWFNEVSGGRGLSLDQVVPHYEAAGYTVNQYSGVMDNQNALPWIANEMGKGRIVQFNLGYTQGHNVSVTRVAYMFDFKHNFIQLNGYNYLQGISGKTVKQIFSVWHP